MNCYALGMQGEGGFRLRKHSAARRTRKTSFYPTFAISRMLWTSTQIRGAGLRLGVDPLGGAARPYWEPINSIYGLEVTVVNPTIEPDFFLHDRGP